MDIYYRKALIIIPAYNEEGRIGKVINEIKEDLPLCSVAVVNDYSKDGTEDEIIAHGAKVINHPYNMGYSSALLTGLSYAVAHGYGYAVFFDGDGQHIASETKRLFEKLVDEDKDMVIGSRFLNPTDYHHGIFKTMGTKLFSGLIRVFAGTRITDPTSGFQLLNSKAIHAYLKCAAYLDYPDANLLIALLKRGIGIAEVAVKMRSREDGESMHGGLWRPIRYMVLVIYSVLLAALSNKRNWEEEV